MLNCIDFKLYLVYNLSNKIYTGEVYMNKPDESGTGVWQLTGIPNKTKMLTKSKAALKNVTIGEFVNEALLKYFGDENEDNKDR